MLEDKKVHKEEYRNHDIIVFQDADTVGSDSPTYFYCAYNKAAKHKQATPVSDFHDIEEAVRHAKERVDKKLSKGKVAATADEKEKRFSIDDLREMVKTIIAPLVEELVESKLKMLDRRTLMLEVSITQAGIELVRPPDEFEGGG
jgi:hypothetical protein